jgi:hypothetical protein
MVTFVVVVVLFNVFKQPKAAYVLRLGRPMDLWYMNTERKLYTKGHGPQMVTLFIVKGNILLVMRAIFLTRGAVA